MYKLNSKFGGHLSCHCVLPLSDSGDIYFNLTCNISHLLLCMHALIMLIILAGIHKTAVFLKGHGVFFLNHDIPRNMLFASLSFEDIGGASQSWVSTENNGAMVWWMYFAC